MKVIQENLGNQLENQMVELNNAFQNIKTKMMKIQELYVANKEELNQIKEELAKRAENKLKKENK